MEKKFTEMSREELVQFMSENIESLDMEVLEQLVQRIDELDGKVKEKSKTLLEEINDEQFESLPMEEQAKKLMSAIQNLIDEAKKIGIEI